MSSQREAPAGPVRVAAEICVPFRQLKLERNLPMGRRVQLHLVRFVGISVRVRGDGRASLRGAHFAAFTDSVCTGGAVIPVASTPANASIARQREEPKFRLSQLSLSLDPSPSLAHLRRRFPRDGRSQRLKRRVDVILLVWCRHQLAGARPVALSKTDDPTTRSEKVTFLETLMHFFSRVLLLCPSKRPHAPAFAPRGLEARMTSSLCCSQRLAARALPATARGP